MECDMILYLKGEQAGNYLISWYMVLSLKVIFRGSEVRLKVI